jgi:hypothetical protein
MQVSNGQTLHEVFRNLGKISARRFGQNARRYREIRRQGFA